MQEVGVPPERLMNLEEKHTFEMEAVRWMEEHRKRQLPLPSIMRYGQATCTFRKHLRLEVGDGVHDQFDVVVEWPASASRSATDKGR